MAEGFCLEFDGRNVPACAGQSIAAALTASGIRAFRQTATGRHRGVFCGMGVCQDCLVEIEGFPNRRACMEPALPDLVVKPQPPLPDLLGAGSGHERPRRPVRHLTPDVLVIGTGAGGLSAAIAARKSGGRVLVLDERHVPGGQFYKQTAGDLSRPPVDRQQRTGARLIEAAIRSGAELVPEAEVWGAFNGPVVYSETPQGGLCVRPRALIVATGAYERPRIIPGWDLPGVMTTGAAQTLWRCYRIRPGARIAFAGNGPLNFQVAQEILRGGATVPLIAEAAPHPSRRGRAGLTMAATGPWLTISGLAMLGWLAARGTRIRFDTVLTRIEALDEGLRVHTFSPRFGAAVVEVDALCMNEGFHPQNEILRMLGAEMHYDEEGDQMVPVRSEVMETTLPGVFAVGDCCGLGGAPAAQVEGRIAGRAAACLEEGPPRHAVRAAHTELARHRRFQAALWDLFRAPRQRLEEIDPAALVCRCEEITAKELLTAARRQGFEIGVVKRETRAGMGRCQGRYCSHVLAPFVARCRDRRLTEREFFAPRPPVKPVSVGTLLRAAEKANDGNDVCV